MNAFCPNLSNKQVKQEFDELVNIFGEDVAYFLWDKNNGYSLDRAPNGAPSLLFSSLMDYYEGDKEKAFIIKSKVYFRPFRDWFGDWILISKNKFGTSYGNTDISYIIDKNGSINFDKLNEITDKYFKNIDDSFFKKGRKNLITRKEHHVGENNTLEHLQNVVKSALISNIRLDLKPFLILSAALHDIAKPFHGGQKHGYQSADLINKIFKGDISPLVKFAVKHHMMTTEEGSLFSLNDAVLIMQDAIDNNLNIQDSIDLLLALNASDIIRGRDLHEIDQYTNKTIEDVINDEIPHKRNLLQQASDIVKTNDVSKVVDENGEPMIVYHGGAKNILAFKKLQHDDYYVDKKTGEKIPADSVNTMFFSSDKYVGISYGTLFGYNYFTHLTYLINSLLDTTYEGRLGISKDAFGPKENRHTTFDEFLYTLDLLSEFNPRLVKFKLYVISLRKENKHMGEKEVKEFRKILLSIRNELDKIDQNILNVTENERDLYISLKILNRYNNKDGIKSLLSGEIPKEILHEWELFKKIEKHRDELKLDKISSYHEVDLFFSRIKRLGFEYDGDKLRFFTENYSDPAIVDMTELLLKDIINSSIVEIKENQNEIKNNERYNKVLSKSQVYPVFLNLRNPFVHDYEGTHFGLGYKQNEELPFGYVAARQVRKALVDGNDGIVYKNIYDPYLADNYGVFNSNQIKHIANIGTFYNTEDNMYRYESKPNKYLGVRFHSYMRDNGYLDENSHPTSALMRRVAVYGYKSQKQMSLILNAIRSIIVNNNLEFNPDDVHYDGRTYRITYTDTSSKKDKSLLKDLFDGYYIESYTGYITVDAVQMINNLIKRGKTNSFLTKLYKLLRPAIANTKCRINLLDERSFYRELNKYGHHNSTAAYYNSDNNTIYVNKDAIFIDNSGKTKNRANTTILHELIHAITVDTVRKSKPLYDEILQIIENVKNTIGELESEKWYGLTGVAEFLAELSNYNFCRLLAGVKIKDKNIILSALQKIKDVLTDVYRFLKSLIGKDVKLELTELGHAFDVLYRAAYSNVHDESLEAVSNFDNTIFAQQSSDSTDELHKRVIELTDKIENLFGQLYRRYEKQSNSTVTRSKTKDELFEKIQELKTLRGVDEIKCIIDYGLNQLGVDIYEVDGELNIGNNNTILHYLKNNQDKDISPRYLIDIKDNILNFYDILLSDKMLSQRIQVDGNLETIVDAVLRKDSKDSAKEYHDKFEVLKQSVETINLLWSLALYKASDNIVDKFIDENLSFDLERKEMLKLTTKEWLHRNQLEGFFDVPLLMYWVYNFETSRSPVVRQMFHMISQAKQRTVQEALPVLEMLSKLFDKANTVDKIFGLGNWLTMLMEKDRDGNYTGNFVSDINRGLYLKDQTEYTENLNAAMIETFGFTYIKDNMTGVIKRSDTETPIDDEEWDSAPYRYWQEHRERWMCAHANRRYTLNYYLERMSQPYSKANKKGHGLSPKTLAAYNKIQSLINYYLDKSVDVKTGYAHPENLDPQDKLKLKYLYDQLKELSSLFTSDGLLKKDDEYDVAMEIISWQTYINQFLFTTIDWDAYNQELDNIEDDLKRNEFIYWNSQIGVNPSYLALAYDGKRDDLNDKELQYLKQSMVSIVKHNREYTYDLSNVQNNMMFFLACKAIDEAQEQIKRKKRAAGLFNQPPTIIIKGRKYNSDEVENTSYLFNDVTALYINQDGEFIQTPDGDYVTWFDYIIDHLTNIIINNDYKIQIATNKFKTFDTDGLDDKLIKAEIQQWLRYQLSYEEERSIGGQLYYSRVPISIFMVKKPTVDLFFNEETEQWEDTIVNVPKGRFKTKSNILDEDAFKFINEDYDIRNPESILPKKELYSNNEQFDAIKNDKNVYNYYKAIIDVMGKYYSDITGQKYMYRMPQLDADNVALMSRHKKLPIGSTLLKYFTGITSRDFDKRSEEEYKDFSDLNTSVVLPRLMKSLEDPNTISSDILNSVSMFIQYAIDYKNNSEIQPMLEVLKYALMDRTERTNPAAGQRQAQLAFELLTRYLYGDDWRWNNQGGDNKIQIATIRAARLASNAASVHMLGGNVLSMHTGAVSSLYSAFKQAGVGKYFTFKELLTSVCDVIRLLPLMIINVGEQNVNTKVGALMRRFGISVNTTTMFKNKYQSRLRKLIPQLAMGGFSAVDYTVNCILLSSVLRHYRFYDGDVIKKGFYTRDELEYLFKDKGLTEKDAKRAFSACSTTLYNAYKYNGDSRIVEIKERFKPYVNAELETLVSKTVKQRVAINNGVSTDDDMSKASQNKIFAIVSAMRNFIWQTAQSMYVGGEDFILPQTEDTEEYNVVGGATTVKKKKVKVKLTQEQKLMRGVVNYAGGRAQFQDDFVRSAYRAVCLGLGKLFNYTKYKNRKFSKPEKYAVRHFAMLLSILATGMYIQVNLDNWAFKKNRGTDWASAALADTHLRGLILIQSEFDLSTLNELINTTTVYSTAVKEKAGIVDYFWNMTPWSDKQNTSIVTSGSYKGSTLGQRTLFRFTGILDNIHTSFTTLGVKSNYDFYTKMYGKMYKTLGYPLGPVRYSGPSLSKMNSINDDFDREFDKTENEFEKFDNEFDNMDF